MEQHFGDDSSKAIGVWASKGNRPWNVSEESITKTQEKTNDEMREYHFDKCTLKDGEKHGWKPETMKAPVLITFAIFTISIILILEYLAQRSQKAGGLSLVDDPTQLSSTVNFAYLYLPLIIAVTYSLLWNWIDLDVKRIQPWLELSMPEGATGKYSLFLDYPVDFVGFIPFKAAKQRHWPVFYSGTIMVLIFWIITPLQSSVLGTRSVLLHQSIEMQTPLQFMDSQAQAAVLDQSILNAAFAMTWLRQPYPAFTTADYALLPFYPTESTDRNVANWTGVTTKYWTDLNCWPAEISFPRPNVRDGVAFYNGRNCTTSELAAMVPKNGHNLLYVGWQDSAWADYSLDAPLCRTSATNQFLAAWFHDIKGPRVNVSAIFCETSYFKQTVRALVQADGLVPVDDHIESLGEPEKLPANEFNSSAFEFLLGVGVSPVDVPREYPMHVLLDQWPRVRDRGLLDPLWSPMVGFALGTDNSSIDDFADHTVLSTTFRASHKRVFSAAFPNLLANTTNPRNASGVAHVVKYGIVVSRLFSGLVEGFLGLVSVLVMLLLWQCHRTPSNLSGDPASLAHLFSMIQSSSLLLRRLMGMETLAAEKLQDKVGDCTFRLVCGCQDISGKTTLRLVGGLDDSDLHSDAKGGRKGTENLGHYPPIKPLALRRLIGISFCLLLCTAIGTLTFFWQQDRAIEGLSQPSSNFEVNIFLTNYVPTIFSTLVEPFWVILNRLLCLLQPFYDLLSDRGTAERTINARYMALPPQLAFWRAFKSGHFLLGLLCITALLGNVLSVGLGAIFHDRPTEKTYPLAMTRYKQPVLSGDTLSQFGGNFVSLDDTFYVITANLSYNTPSAPWMTTDFSFVPINVSSQSSSKDIIYSATTTAFGVEPSCKSLGFYVSEDQPPRLDPSLGNPHGNFTNCARNFQPPTLLLKNDVYVPPDGPCAAEVVTTFAEGGVPQTDCGQSILFGWSRSDVRNATGTMNTSFIICTPTIKTGEVRVSFDYQGRILNATAQSNLTAPHAGSTDNLVPLLNTLHKRLSTNTHWHNDSLSHDWFMYLLSLRMGDHDIFNPLAPTPDPTLILPAISSLYKQMIATAFNGAQGAFFNGSGDAIIGSQTVVETRIFLSSPAFVVSITILSLYILMAILFYGWGVTFFLPRMPTTIGSLLAYIAPSSLANAESRHKGGLDDRVFRFGRLVGPDGRAHIGIDLSDKVVPLDPVSLVKGDTRHESTIFGVRFRRWGRMRGRGQEVLI